MIKFFRKIRQKLLSEDKFSSYLKYAIGEIILVVIGILIALQINNWNESKKLNTIEKEFVVSIKNDLLRDKEYLKDIIGIIEPKNEAYKILNNDLNELYTSDRKSLDSVFLNYFSSQRTFYPISDTYESAVSGNQLTQFKSIELIQKLVKLYNSTYDRLIENGQILDERWAFISKKYSYERRTGNVRDMDREAMSELLDDIYHHYVQMNWYLEQLISTTEEIDEVLIWIENNS